MDTLDDILVSLGRIEGRLVHIEKLSERVTQLEMWQSWLKGGCAALLGGFAYIFRQVTGK